MQSPTIEVVSPDSPGYAEDQRLARAAGHESRLTPRRLREEFGGDHGTIPPPWEGEPAEIDLRRYEDLDPESIVVVRWRVQSR